LFFFLLLFFVGGEEAGAGRAGRWARALGGGVGAAGGVVFGCVAVAETLGESRGGAIGEGGLSRRAAARSCGDLVDGTADSLSTVPG